MDDNTVAFAQWAMGANEPPEPDTVVSKRSRPSAPGSACAKAMPRPAAELLAGEAKATPETSTHGVPGPSLLVPPSAGAPTPGGAGPQAPAPTPASGSRPAGAPAALTLDPATLASKLAEMAEQHDVTLEVPMVRAWAVERAGASWSWLQSAARLMPLTSLYCPCHRSSSSPSLRARPSWARHSLVSLPLPAGSSWC